MEKNLAFVLKSLKIVHYRSLPSDVLAPFLIAFSSLYTFCLCLQLFALSCLANKCIPICI